MHKKIFISLLSFVFAVHLQAQQGNSILNIEVSLSGDSISKEELLQTIAKQFDINFSYNPELIRAHEKVKIETRNTPLYSILQSITKPEKFNFKAFDNQVVFFPVEHEPAQKHSEMPIILNGKAYDAQNQDAISFCNISVAGEVIGTMSNSNGYYSLKIPAEFEHDSIGFSSLGYEVLFKSVQELKHNPDAGLEPRTYHLRQIDVINYDPLQVLKKVHEATAENYENEYTLLTNYYRETTLENKEYTDISEAIIQVMKAPYTNEIRQDHVKFIKGRKASEVRPPTDIRFRLMGGPHYITMLDVVKNHESFLNPDFRHLYNFKYEKTTTIDNRNTLVISFKPAFSVRDILYEGTLYIDTESYAVARAEFKLTRKGLREVQSSLVQKEPRNTKATPTSLEYTVQYKHINNKWYLLWARSSMEVRINNRDKRERTNFSSIAEIVTTNIEKGNIQKFNRNEIFRANEIFTDKIVSYDPDFWENYNIIKPEEKLVDALKSFDNKNLFITHKQK